MERKTASDFHPEVLRLFDGYVHGGITRREFLDRAAKYAVGGFTAAAMLESLKPNFAWAQQVPKEDARIRTETASYPTTQGSGKVTGYLVKPAKGPAKLPAVVVIHENRGLNPYIEDVTRRLGVLGYLAFAPDALTPLGGYPKEGEDKARELFPKLDQAKTREDFVAATNYARTRPDSTGKIGAVGFCYGGGMVNYLASRLPELAAGVAFYGGAGSLDDVKNVKAAMLIHHGSTDTRLVEAWPAHEAALKAAGVRYEGYVYQGAAHGFNNDTTPRFDAAAAKLAWERTVAHFNKYLR